MKKNLFIIPLSVLAIGLSSCGDKNSYTITDKSTISFEFESQTVNTFGKDKLNIKKGNTYTFTFDFSKVPTTYKMSESVNEDVFGGIEFDFSVDKNESSVKYNNKELVGRSAQENDEEDWDFEYAKEQQKFGLLVAVHINTDKIKMKKDDKLTFSLKATNDSSDSSLIGVYAA